MFRYAVIGGIRFYRAYLSRFTRNCSRTPICSTYALRSVQRHGAVTGLRMYAERLRTPNAASKNIPYDPNSMC